MGRREEPAHTILHQPWQSRGFLLLLITTPRLKIRHDQLTHVCLPQVREGGGQDQPGVDRQRQVQHGALRGQLRAGQPHQAVHVPGERHATRVNPWSCFERRRPLLHCNQIKLQQMRIPACVSFHLLSSLQSPMVCCHRCNANCLQGIKWKSRFACLAQHALCRNLHYHRDTPNPSSVGLKEGTLKVRETRLEPLTFLWPTCCMLMPCRI